jgi:hypothetical protein
MLLSYSSDISKRSQLATAVTTIFGRCLVDNSTDYLASPMRKPSTRIGFLKTEASPRRTVTAIELLLSYIFVVARTTLIPKYNVLDMSLAS